MRRATALLLVLALGPLSGARAAWTRSAAGDCVREWTPADLGRGPIAMLNAPLAPFRAGAGAVQWVLTDDTQKRSSAQTVVLVPALGFVGGAAGIIDTIFWLVLGLADTVTGGAFMIAPDDATALSVAPTTPFWARAPQAPPRGCPR